MLKTNLGGGAEDLNMKLKDMMELLKTNLGGVWQAAALYWTAVVGDTYE